MIPEYHLLVLLYKHKLIPLNLDKNYAFRQLFTVFTPYHPSLMGMESLTTLILSII